MATGAHVRCIHRPAPSPIRHSLDKRPRRTENSLRMSAYDGVVILGFPRSGTTLLRRLLNAHPALCCPPETNVLNACGRFLAEHDIARGLKIGAVAGLAYSGIPEADVLGRLRALAFGLFADIRDR